MVYKRIRDLREDSDLKQSDIAKMLNCSQQAYSNYELGVRDIPTDILMMRMRRWVAMIVPTVFRVVTPIYAWIVCLVCVVVAVDK